MPSPEGSLANGGAPAPAVLTYEGTSIELPVVEPILGRTALDISALGQHGLSVYDPGYADTAAYHSSITFVDGEGGRLYYRGYPVEQLATSASFLEVAYLLINGELPARRQRTSSPAECATPSSSFRWVSSACSTASPKRCTPWPCWQLPRRP